MEESEMQEKKKHKFTQEEREQIAQIMEEKIMNEDDNFVYEVLELMLSDVIELSIKTWGKVIKEVEDIYEVIFEEVEKVYNKLEEGEDEGEE